MPWRALAERIGLSAFWDGRTPIPPTRVQVTLYLEHYCEFSSEEFHNKRAGATNDRKNSCKINGGNLITGYLITARVGKGGGGRGAKKARSRRRRYSNVKFSAVVNNVARFVVVEIFQRPWWNINFATQNVVSPVTQARDYNSPAVKYSIVRAYTGN